MLKKKNHSGFPYFGSLLPPKRFWSIYGDQQPGESSIAQSHKFCPAAPAQFYYSSIEVSGKKRAAAE